MTFRSLVLVALALLLAVPAAARKGWPSRYPIGFTSYRGGHDAGKAVGRQLLVYFCSDKLNADKDPLCQKLTQDKQLRSLTERSCWREFRWPRGPRSVGGRFG